MFRDMCLRCRFYLVALSSATVMKLRPPLPPHSRSSPPPLTPRVIALYGRSDFSRPLHLTGDIPAGSVNSENFPRR